MYIKKYTFLKSIFFSFPSYRFFLNTFFVVLKFFKSFFFFRVQIL